MEFTRYELMEIAVGLDLLMNHRMRMRHKQETQDDSDELLEMAIQASELQRRVMKELGFYAEESNVLYTDNSE